jgi:hypothetical protein
MDAEEWRPIPGYEHRYEASDHGNVRSVGKSGRVLRPGPHRQGYRMATLYDGLGGRRTIKMARLVLLAFVGPPPPGKPDALHWDDDPKNDHIRNLRWGSKSENQRDLIRNGNHSSARKQRDALGHLLVEPNLVPSAVGRQCLACKRTLSTHRADARRQPTNVHRSADGFLRRLGESFEDEANRRYAHIMRDQDGLL